MSEIFLDTNVLVSCIDTTRRLHREAFALIDRVRGGELKAFISTQVVGEFYVSLTKSHGGLKAPLSAEEAGEELEALLGSGLFTLLPVTPGVVSRAVTLSVQKGIRGIRFWDVVIVATMLEGGLSTLCTENFRDFKGFSDVVRVLGPEDL